MKQLMDSWKNVDYIVKSDLFQTGKTDLTKFHPVDAQCITGFLFVYLNTYARMFCHVLSLLFVSGHQVSFGAYTQHLSPQRICYRKVLFMKGGKNEKL